MFRKVLCLAGTERELSGAGAPGWKQRAFYDFVKDLSPILFNVKVVRISVWDKIQEVETARTIADVLKSPKPESNQSL